MRAEIDLRVAWERMWRGIGARGDGGTLHAELLERYSEGHRHYHTTRHLTECLSALQAVRHLAERPAVLEAALWFHDAIYEPARGDNEALSAEWAERCLQAASVAPAIVDTVRDLVLLTRADTLDAQQIDARRRRIRALAQDDALPVFACGHAPQDFVSRPDGAVLPLAAIDGRDVVLLTAVARPDSVRSTVEGLGARVVADLRHRDHHRFSKEELAAAARAAEQHGAVVVTTEKDDARIDDGAIARLVLRIGLRFLDGEPTDAELKLP